MKSLRLVLSIALLAVSSSGLRAAELFWDPNATAGATLGGTGTWDTFNSYWYNGTSDLAWVNANNDDANFTGPAGTVTLTNAISVGNIYFTNVTGNYYITNDGGGEVLTVGGTIDTGGGEHTLDVPVTTSSGTLNKNGDGRLHLSVANSLNIAMVNQGELSIETNGASASSTIVASGAALEFNGGAGSTLSNVTTSVTISGTGITNSGALRNKSGVTTDYGQIILAADSTIYSDPGTALANQAENGALTDNGGNYNLTISGPGNFDMGATSIGGILNVYGNCFAYLNGISPAVWKATYVGPGAKFFVENPNSFGLSANPASLIATNCVVDGGSITSGGGYTMYVNAGITFTANGGFFTNNTSTLNTGSIFSPANGNVSFTANGSSTIAITAASTGNTLNIGTGTLTLNGSGSTKLQSGVADVYSNLVINGSTFTFNYDTSGGAANLGTAPNALTVSNIFLNGGQFHVGHSTTMAATRGIYVTSAGTTINEVTGGGTATFASTFSGPGTVTFNANNYILTANNSYGATVINASTALTVGSGAAGTLGTGNTTENGALIINRTGTYTYGGIISGTGGMSKTGAGVFTLTGINTYSGVTTNITGSLLINGTNSGAATIYNLTGATLGGTGVIKGVVTNNAGGTIYLGLGTLSVSNNVSNAGNVAVVLNKSLTQSNGMLAVLPSSSIYNLGTGSIFVTNVGPALVAGDTFHVFSKAVTGSGTPTIYGITNVVWNNNIAVDGTISVASAPTPLVNKVQISGTNFVFSGTNGPGLGKYYVLSTTNLTTPLSQWTDVSTNSFNNSGQFFITNPMVAGGQLFYSLQVP